MSTYIARRLLQMIPLLFGISIVTYAVIRAAPGDPARLLADPERVTAAQLESMRQQLGLNDPLPIQYLKTMRGLLTGDLRSFKTHRPVLSMIGERLPTTLMLTGPALIFGVTLDWQSESRRRCARTAGSTTPAPSPRCSDSPCPTSGWR